MHFSAVRIIFAIVKKESNCSEAAKKQLPLPLPPQQKWCNSRSSSSNSNNNNRSVTRCQLNRLWAEKIIYFAWIWFSHIVWIVNCLLVFFVFDGIFNDNVSLSIRFSDLIEATQSNGPEEKPVYAYSRRFEWREVACRHIYTHIESYTYQVPHQCYSISTRFVYDWKYCKIAFSTLHHTTKSNTKIFVLEHRTEKSHYGMRKLPYKKNNNKFCSIESIPKIWVEMRFAGRSVGVVSSTQTHSHVRINTIGAFIFCCPFVSYETDCTQMSYNQME